MTYFVWFCGKVIFEPRGKIEQMTSDLSQEQEDSIFAS
jgi:hypothetical protein